MKTASQYRQITKNICSSKVVSALEKVGSVCDAQVNLGFQGARISLKEELECCTNVGSECKEEFKSLLKSKLDSLGFTYGWEGDCILVKW